MTKTFLFIVISIMILGKANSYEYNGVAADLALGYQTNEIANHAHENDVKASDLVADLINNDIDVVRAVQTVVKTWSSCDDTYSAVQKGVQSFPQRANEIVASIATMKNCNCSAESYWAKSRLMKRLNPNIQKSFIRVNSLCGCSAAGIAAAVEIVPSKAEDMIRSVLTSKNRASSTVDSLGKIGQFPDQFQWNNDDLKTQNTNLVRKIDACRGDKNASDGFSANQSWYQSGDGQFNTLEHQSNNKLGFHKIQCDEENKETRENNKEDSSSKRFLISQYIQEGNNQSLEFYNHSDKPIDLLLDNYQVEIYFHGYDFPGSIVQLNGVVPPKSTFVLSSSDSSPSIKSLSNQTVNGLNFKGADAISLNNGFPISSCQCASTTVASALNGLQGNNNDETANPEIDKSKSQLVKQLKAHYASSNSQLTPVDSIGQLKTHDDENQNNSNQEEVQAIVTNANFRRFTNTCKGDNIEVDEFDFGHQWDKFDSAKANSVGIFDAKNCPETRDDLLLSEYQHGSDNNNLIELYNGTARPIDFDYQEYYLELFGEDHNNAKHKIKLEGIIEPNSTFVLTHDDAIEELKSKANQSTSDLILEDTFAIVLKKSANPSFKSCQNEIANFVRNTDLEDPIVLILDPILDPGVGPDSDDDPSDGDDGGQIASPN